LALRRAEPCLVEQSTILFSSASAPRSTKFTGIAWRAWCLSARAIEAKPERDSDYDIAVFIKELGDVSDALDIETDILYDTGAVINALPFAADAYLAALIREGAVGQANSSVG
jgi:hypothetical protein